MRGVLFAGAANPILFVLFAILNAVAAAFSSERVVRVILLADVCAVVGFRKDF